MTILRTEMPLFSTPAGGGTLALWQRAEMLVALLHPEGCPRCDGLRALLAARAPQLGGERIGMVEVRLEGPRPAPGELPERLARAARQPAGLALLLIADRFARVYAAIQVHGDEASGVLGEALEWLTFIQSQCEECGAPVDWA